ncbi:MAG: MBL fold metallo-hydrolase [Actinomycetota bacterium]|nr:MBL fold metallo-hydrolase [Actinomycetota bacterium]
MRITKFGHACVRLERDGQVLVVDPGAFTEPEAVDGAGAVLVTHEHPDHLDVDRLRRVEVPVYAGDGVAQALRDQAPDVAERLQVVRDGDEVSAAGMRVTVHGEEHALIHDDIPRIVNTGFCVEDHVFHPGDSFTAPPRPMPMLLVPVHAPWMRLAEAVDFARKHTGGAAVAVHDGLLNDNGLAVTDRMMGGLLEARDVEFRHVAPGDDV